MCRTALVWPLPVTPRFFEALDDAVKNNSMRGFKLLSLYTKELFNKILWDQVWQPESAPLYSPDLLGLFERKIFLANLWHGRLHFECENDEIGIIGKYRDEV